MIRNPQAVYGFSKSVTGTRALAAHVFGSLSHLAHQALTAPNDGTVRYLHNGRSA